MVERRNDLYAGDREENVYLDDGRDIEVLERWRPQCQRNQG